MLVDPAKVQARLEELTEATARSEARIAEVGLVGEVEQLRARAKADWQMATETLAGARAEVARLRGTALEERDAAVAEAAKLRQDLAAERTTLAEAIGLAARDATERESRLAARESAVETNGRRAAEALLQGQALKDEFEARLERLKVATAQA
jgi:hypothetical protein